MALNYLVQRAINEEIRLINGVVRLPDGTSILNTLAKAPEAQPDTFRRFFFDPSRARPPDRTPALQQRFYAVFPSVRELVLHGVTPVDHKKHEKILRHFTGITFLRISCWDFRKFKTKDIKRILDRFCETVKTLEIHRCGVNSDVLIFLTSLFPHVENLSIEPAIDISGGTYKFELCKSSGQETYLVKGSGTPLNPVKFRGNFTFMPLVAEHENFIAFVKEHSSGIRSIHVRLWQKSEQIEKLFKRSEPTLLSASVCFFFKGKFIATSLHHNTHPIVHRARHKTLIPRSTPKLVDSSPGQIRTGRPELGSPQDCKLSPPQKN